MEISQHRNFRGGLMNLPLLSKLQRNLKKHSNCVCCGKGKDSRETGDRRGWQTRGVRGEGWVGGARRILREDRLLCKTLGRGHMPLYLRHKPTERTAPKVSLTVTWVMTVSVSVSFATNTHVQRGTESRWEVPAPSFWSILLWTKQLIQNEAYV